MPYIPSDNYRLRDGTLSQLRNDRKPWWSLWRELADFILPKRYVWLETDKDRRAREAKNRHILDGTGTKCARVLAAGMLNGITSPSRPWFTLRVPGFTEDPASRARAWVEEVARRMHQIMAETNYYNALATMYLDLSVFGSAAMLIYEDDDNVFRCFNPALGEFYFGQDASLRVGTFGREISMTVGQLVREFGEENVSTTVRDMWKKGGADLHHSFNIAHLVEPNDDGKSNISSRFAYRETYWEKGKKEEKDGRSLVLRERGFNELPGIFPRWELTGNDAYGTSPGMDALPDIIQLQHETKRKAQGLDKMISPPVVADIQLAHRPTALVPNGITYVAGQGNVGVRPAYQVQVPIDALTADILDIRQRIAEIFHNPLFNMISQLDTVRSATEIDARREEKLVLLGPVLERFENEALDPSINRIFSIMQRRQLLPEPPPELEGMDVQVQYVSILSTAQRAISAAPTERWVGLIGNIAPVVPQALTIPNWDSLIRNYGEAIGVPARDMNTREQSEEMVRAEEERIAAQEAAVAGRELVDGAKVLSETDVGGGGNALQRMLNG